MKYLIIPIILFGCGQSPNSSIETDAGTKVCKEIVNSEDQGFPFEGGNIPSGTYTLTNITEYIPDGGSRITEDCINQVLQIEDRTWSDSVSSGVFRIEDHVVYFTATNQEQNFEGVFTWKDGDFLLTSSDNDNLIIKQYSYKEKQ